MAGGTWKIIVEEGATKQPTQSSVSGPKVLSPEAKAKQTAEKASKQQERMIQRTKQVLGAGAFGLGVAGVNQYYSITGQTARKNGFNATVTYGALSVRAISQLATGNVPGAIATTIAAGALAGTQYFNFRKEIAEQDASAEYLRRRSATSVNNGKDIYRFSL